jgi:hypothetical protein
METSFSTIRFVTHNLQKMAILKLPKLALCLFPAIALTTQSDGWGGKRRGKL